MDNYSYPTTAYSDSVQSSPRSTRDLIDGENTWDDNSPRNYKVKLMCSYGGKIQPRPHDNQLTYVAGDTKIFAVDRNIKFSLFISKLSSLCDVLANEVCFRYQLPGEDLDALISVTNDEDLEHMMLEYDRLCRGSVKPARLRLFLFPVNPPPPSSVFSSSDSKSDRQWFVDALNSVQNSNLQETSSPSALSNTPDFLFGLDKGQTPPGKVQQDSGPPPPPVTEVLRKEIRGGSDDRSFVEPVVSPAEMQRQIHDLENMHISNQEQVNLRGGYYGDFYGQKISENTQQQAPPVNIPAGYWQERQMSNAGVGVFPPATANEPPYYMIPTSAGVYQTPVMRPMTSQVGQGYYGMQRMVPEIHREQQVYNVVPQQSFQPKNNTGAYTVGPGTAQPTEHGYGQVGYDGAGRQVYYTVAGGVMQQQFQAVDGRQGGGELNQERR